MFTNLHYVFSYLLYCLCYGIEFSEEFCCVNNLKYSSILLELPDLSSIQLGEGFCIIQQATHIIEIQDLLC